MEIRSFARFAGFLGVLGISTAGRADDVKPAPAKPPFNYVWAKAYHILKETTSDESGYFSLVEGTNGLIYVGTAKYGQNGFMIEFDPKTEKQRIAFDTNSVTGATGRGYAAQSKIHTKNYVGPSGTLYCGSKEGYPSADEVKNNDVAPYAGGYVMTYDTKTHQAKNLGMPYPGQGVDDVVADESRGLIYVITCENQYWMVYDTKAPKKRFRWLGPELFPYASTIVDNQGRANSISKEYQMARWDPATNKLTMQDIMLDGKKMQLPPAAERTGWIPNWVSTPDHKSAYLIRMSFPEVYKLDLTGDIDKPVTATLVCKMMEGHAFTDCRSGISLGPDGKVYTAIAVPNDVKYGDPYELTHITRCDPANGKVEDLGVVGVQNPDFFNFKAVGPDGKQLPFTYGYKTLPDGTLTPQYQPLGSIVAHDGTTYVLILYPYTLLRIPPVK